MEEVPSLTVDYGSLTVRIEAIISNAGLNVFPERKRKELWVSNFVGFIFLIKLIFLG